MGMSSKKMLCTLGLRTPSTWRPRQARGLTQPRLGFQISEQRRLRGSPSRKHMVPHLARAPVRLRDTVRALRGGAARLEEAQPLVQAGRQQHLAVGVPVDAAHHRAARLRLPRSDTGRACVPSGAAW